MFLRTILFKNTSRFNVCFYYSLKNFLTFRNFNRNILNENFVRKFHINRQMNDNVDAYSLISSDPYNYSIVNFDCKISSEDQPIKMFVDKLNTKWSELTHPEMIDSFTCLSNYAFKEGIDISSNVLDNFIDSLADRMCQLNDSELEIVGKNLLKWPTIYKRSRNYIEIWSAFDDALVKRVVNWDNKSLLLFMDYIHHLNVEKFTDYPRHALNKLTRKHKSLTDKEFIQTAFYIGLTRIPPSTFHNMEVRLRDCLDSLSTAELTIVCIGFMKTLTPLRQPEIVERILQRITSEVNTIDNFTTSIILSVLRTSVIPDQSAQIQTLLDSLQKQLQRFSLSTCTYIVMCKTRIGLYHKEIIEAVAKKLLANTSSARLIDLQRLMVTFGMFYLDKQLVEEVALAVIKELRDPRLEVQIFHHGPQFISCLYHLAIVGKYPLDLIFKALQPDYLKKAYGNNYTIGSEGLALDCSVEIECDNYDGPKMDGGRRFYLSRTKANYIPEVGDKYKKNFTEVMMLETMLLLEEIRGKEYTFTGHLLPHYERADIVIGTTPNGEPIKMDGFFPKKCKFGTVIHAPDKENSWTAFVIVGKQCFSTNTHELLGTSQMKLRHLKKLCFSPVLISFLEWQHLKTTDEKIQYLRGKAKAVNVIL